MSAITATWILLALAAALLLIGGWQAAAFVALGAIVVVLTAPNPEHEDARRRNQAHRR